MAVFTVSDQGPGIPEEDCERIFERFYRVEKERVSPSSTGLGLAIVKEIIQSHGEQIDVVSTEKVGTEFIFSLPCADETY